MKKKYTSLSKKITKLRNKMYKNIKRYNKVIGKLHTKRNQIYRKIKTYESEPHK